MADFLMTDVVRMRALRRARARMKDICDSFPLLSRDAVVELLDACRRNPDDSDALAQANRVMDNRRRGIPMINNLPVTDHAKPTPYRERTFNY